VYKQAIITVVTTQSVEGKVYRSPKEVNLSFFF